MQFGALLSTYLDICLVFRQMRKSVTFLGLAFC